MLPKEELFTSTKTFIDKVRNTVEYKLMNAARPHWYSDPPLAATTIVSDCISEMLDEADIHNIFITADNKSTGSVICKFCLTSISSNPAIYLADHLALNCCGTSHELRIQFYDIIKDKAGRGGQARKRKIEELSMSLTTPPSVTRSQTESIVNNNNSEEYSSAPKRSRQGNIHEFMMRIPDDAVKSIDADVANFFFTEGIPLIKFKNQYLQRALSKIPGGFSERSELSYWNLRHKFVDSSNSRVSNLIEEDLNAGEMEQITSDGWGNPVRHDHILNIMIKGGANHKTYFKQNIYTKGSN